MSILRVLESIKSSPTRFVGMALSSAALVSLSLIAAPPAAQAKEKRSADSSRPDRQATRTRPPANSSGSGSSAGSSTASQGRTPTATQGTSGSSSRTTVRRQTPESRSEQTRSSDPRTRHPQSVTSSSQRHDYYSRDRGGYYGRHYVPYYGWIYGPDWARYYYPGFYGASYYRPFYDGWWGSYWDWFFYTGATVRHDRVVRAGDYGPSGALDLDVSPEEAEIWIDGAYLGIADNFDGFPEYLWLPVGRTTVTFYLPGYETVTRDFDIRSNDVIKVDDSMRRGEAVHPEDLRPAPQPRVERG
ncbi:MAG: PEGA domain-containing protein, partial [Thermoanaerobaculia bacterium]|nr:PEGA domain-containing protein [Thermoanaerobaculia bacterium]